MKIIEYNDAKILEFFFDVRKYIINIKHGVLTVL